MESTTLLGQISALSSLNLFDVQTCKKKGAHWTSVKERFEDLPTKKNMDGNKCSTLMNLGPLFVRTLL